MTRQQIIGNAILKQKGFFSLDQIVQETRYRRDDARQALAGFVKEGLIKEIRRRKKSQYKGGAAPLIILYAITDKKRLIEKISPKCRGSNNLSDRMWFVIRKKEYFTRRDLRVLAGITKETARWYTKMLARAGIIRQGGRGEWRLLKDVGPRRPYVGDQVTKMRNAE
jgi:Fic family protein